MSLKKTNRTNLKGMVVKNPETDEVNILFPKSEELITLASIFEDYLNEEVKISITYENKIK